MEGRRTWDEGNRFELPLLRSAFRVASLLLFFFFQAEDGIRDRTVTGVQTCALPISAGGGLGAAPRDSPAPRRSTQAAASSPLAAPTSVAVDDGRAGGEATHDVHGDLRARAWDGGVPLGGGHPVDDSQRCQQRVETGRKRSLSVTGKASGVQQLHMSRAGIEPATLCLKGRCSTD